MAVAFLGRNMRSAVPQLQEPAVPRETRDDERRRLVAVVRDRYDIQRELGRGGMSSVFVAWDRRGRRRVAIKLQAAGLSLSVEHRERFRREAWITTRLAHPHIVPCYDFVRSGDVVYTVMPYIAGRSLAALLAGGRRLEAAAAVAVFAPIADALAHAHAIGVVHRDVKPANILLQRSTGRPYLADFGIATLRTSELRGRKSRSGSGRLNSCPPNRRSAPGTPTTAETSTPSAWSHFSRWRAGCRFPEDRRSRTLRSAPSSMRRRCGIWLRRSRLVSRRWWTGASRVGRNGAGNRRRPCTGRCTTV